MQILLDVTENKAEQVINVIRSLDRSLIEDMQTYQDETEYLSSSSENKKRLDSAVAQIESNQNLVTKNLDDLTE